MTIRTFAVKDGRESDLGSYTYVVGKSHTLPIIVLSGPYETTIGPKGVDQMNKAGNGIEAEVMMTLIEGGEEKFSIPAGITLHGNNGGSRDIPKKNFNVHFRSAYGAGKLHYKVFDDLEIDEFNSLLLKGGAEDWYRTMIRDEFMTHMVIGNTALLAQACKPVVLYLGGEFWGIYFLRERFSADYVASHFNVSKESVNLMSGYGNVEEGSSKSYNEIVKFVKNNDLNKDENYDWFAEHVDIDSLMDWYICRSYMGDKDFANIRYFNSTEGDGKWRWMFYDLDWGFDPSSATQANPITGIIQNNDRHILIYKLARPLARNPDAGDRGRPHPLGQDGGRLEQQHGFPLHLQQGRQARQGRTRRHQEVFRPLRFADDRILRRQIQEITFLSPAAFPAGGFFCRRLGTRGGDGLGAGPQSPAERNRKVGLWNRTSPRIR